MMAFEIKSSIIFQCKKNYGQVSVRALLNTLDILDAPESQM